MPTAPTEIRQVDDQGVFRRVVLEPRALQLFWRDDAGQGYASVEGLRRALQQRGQALYFATNGGIYDTDQTPKGLYVEDFKQRVALDARQKGGGNFYMQPNGVFAIDGAGVASVLETQRYREQDPSHTARVRFATQSGPMLVSDARINPHFDANSSSLNLRVGVGVLPSGQALFIIADLPVNFYTFAKQFLDAGCQNALYLDGGPPAVLFTPSSAPADWSRAHLVPIIAVAVPAQP